MNAADDCRYAALHIAVSSELVEMIRILLEAGADVYYPGGDSAQCVLCIAAIRGHCDIVRLLLAAGAIVNAVDVHHDTPLHYAAQHGHHQVLGLLPEAGGQIDRIGHKGRTALHRAASFADDSASHLSMMDTSAPVHRLLLEIHQMGCGPFCYAP